MSLLKKKYKEQLLPKLLETRANKNIMEMPKLVSIVVSMGIAEAAKDKNAMQDHINEITQLTGQKPIVTLAKKSISNFKLREGSPLGLKVTLRGKRMYDFFDRFCNLVCPRIRDFRGFKAKCDGRGNYNVGLQDQQVFLELNLDQVKRRQGMNIAFVTNCGNDADCIELLTMMGFPFKEKEN